MSAISRQSEARLVTIPEANHLTEEFSLAGYASGSFQLPAALTSATIGVQVSLDAAAWAPLTNAVGTAVTVCTVVAAGAYPLPAEAFSFPWARLESNLDEAAGRSVQVFLKG
jgi:hypothetical protein